MIHSKVKLVPSGMELLYTKNVYSLKISICSHKSNLQRSANGPLLSEATIWAIIMQLTSGLRAIHQAGLACK